MMGQMPRKPLMGEVEVGLEALVLLESREEERTQVLRVLSSPGSPPSPHQRRTSRAHRQRRIHRNQSIRKEKEDDKACGSQRVSATSLPDQLQMDTEEQQLADVYYSACYLHPPREVLVQDGARAKVAEGGDKEDTSSTVTREQLKTELKDIFDVDDATMAAVEHEVLAREPPHTTLRITIHGAKDLKPKTSKETSHPYCIVRMSGSTETEIYRTPVLLSTLSPAWEAEFECSILCLRDAKLSVEIWHEPQEAGKEQLKGMKDIRRELGRLVRDAAANLQPKETRNLLGTVTVPLPDVKEQSVEGWYSLVKSKEEGMNQPGTTRDSLRDGKKRGSVHLSLRFSTSAQLYLIGPHWYNGFLNKVVQHDLQYINSFSHRTRGGSTRRSDRSTYSYRSSLHSTRSNGMYCSTRRPRRNCSDSPTSSGSSFENEMTWNFPTMWSGTVNGASSSLLDYYSTILGLSPAAATLAWWNIASKIPIVDQAFLGELLKRLQNYISEDKFSQQDIEEISSSLKLWTESELNRLSNLTDHYPAASSRIVSYAQIKSLLANFHVLQANPHTQCLKVFPNDAAISELVSEALMDFVKNWWESTLKSRGRNSPLAHEDQQLGIVVCVASDVCSFLTDVSNFYHDVFLREAKISYLRLAYILLTSELAARIRPLLHKLYDSPASRQTSSHTAHGEVDKHSLEAGTPVWQLYKKLELIQRIGENLPMEVQLQSGIHGYHQWYLGAVTRWQERLMARTTDLMAREVEKDTFEMNSSHISSSADGIKSNFTIIINSWEKLAWPDDDNIVGKKLVKEMCGLGTLYTKIVLHKLETGSRGDKSPSTTFLSPQSCIVLNNIEFLRHEVHNLPELFDLPQDNDDDQFSIIPKTLSKMEGSILRLMDSAIRKVKPTLHSAVVRSCETGSEVLLLQDVLDQDLSVLRHQLIEANLQRLLLKIWNVLIVIFCSIVNNNSTKRNAEYFKNVYRVLERSWYFFTPTDRQGLDPQHAHTEEYQSLQKILCNLKMPTESLIAKYYKERHEELQHAYNTYLAELVVRVFFLATGKLIVEVIMARNIGRSSVKSPDTFVQVKLVPSDWFPNVQSQKTKIQKKCDSPVYDEKLELPVSENGVKNGYLLFLLKTSRHLFQSSEVFAEAVLPLEDLPSVDTHIPCSVKNKVLYMNMPRKGEDYTAVKALKFRTWDTRAQNFLQAFSDRT